MKFLFAFLIFIIRLIVINGECKVEFQVDSAPIFIPQNENDFLIIESDHITFGQNNYLYAVCSTGFSSISYRQSNEYYAKDYDGEEDQALVLRCVNKDTKIEINNEIKALYSKLNCKYSTSYNIYEGSYIKNCDKKLYTINLNIKNSSLNFADICFDPNNMRIDFLHYETKKLDKMISYKNFNFENNEILQYLTKSEAPADIFFIDEDKTQLLIQNIIGYEYSFLQFQYEEFYPKYYWFPNIADPLVDAKTLNRFLGWRNFIEGNWRLFRKLLETRSKNVIYDVYLGTSDVVIIPSYDDCNNLKELRLKLLYNKVATVPKYVWAYLKSKENDPEEFVVIGVNSPYFEFFPRNETIFCDDICHEIDWFSSLEKFRKMSTFGYMFCCRKEQVQKRLDGFPNFQNINQISQLTQISDIPYEDNYEEILEN